MRYHLTTARPSDDAWLEELRRDVYRDLFQATWGGWDEERHQRHFSACIEKGGISIIEFNGNRIGMIQLLESDGELEVAEIQIHTKYQNQGIGTSVLKDVIASARQRGQVIHLRVGLKNDKAVRLYESLGFSPTTKSETHINMKNTL
jgi:ribosomal protein S18 acetylase RimI-like enzyme